ncbi:hypothetical protein TorRG33x02_171350 [Trema orientale]|uniref:Uncharacterized protein n=1 Tax=Trema orientale TaxID=63057 RepID=A0A2P5ENE7_TREOI|nr:hypothetical protein TorRG33x02_171350 [Trema orientale]
MVEDRKGQSLLHEKDDPVNEIDPLRLEKENQQATMALTEEIENVEQKLQSFKINNKFKGEMADQIPDVSIEKSFKELVFERNHAKPTNCSKEDERFGREVPVYLLKISF